jgi:hypothetical protein
MRTIWILVAVSLLLGPFGANGVRAAGVIVGVNVVGVQKLSESQQDALLDQLQKAGVKAVRCALDDKSIHFITNASKRGIGAVVIVDPLSGNTVASQQARRANPPLTTWSVGRLSDADPEGFKRWLTSQLAALQRNGVKLTAMEIGNEINSPAYNGDFSVPGDGRVLGVNDLQAGWKAWSGKQPITDPEATAVAKGFTLYVSIVAAAKAVARETSPLNKDTPVITAGAVYNTDLPHPAKGISNNGPAHGVPAADFIQFLRQRGLDDHVDGYGIHIYYSAPKDIDSALSICGGPAGKPCWLTEWGGYPTTDTKCPPGVGSGNDPSRSGLISKVRAALRPFISRGLLADAMYYSWNSGGAIYIPSCSGVTPSGMAAIAPFK